MKTFQRFGKGVFDCQCCERSTRETNRDHGQTDLCAECFELAGIENAFSDRPEDREVLIREYGDEVRQHVAKIAKLGGSTNSWEQLLSIVNSKQQMETKMKKNAKTVAKKTAPKMNRTEKKTAKAKSLAKVARKTGVKTPDAKRKAAKVQRIQLRINRLEKRIAAAIAKNQVRASKIKDLKARIAKLSK